MGWSFYHYGWSTPQHQISGTNWAEMKQKHNRRLPVYTTDTYQTTSADTPDYISRQTRLYQQHTNTHTPINTHTSLLQQTCQSTPVALHSTSVTYQTTIVTHNSTSTDTKIYTSNTCLQERACWINWTRASLC